MIIFIVVVVVNVDLVLFVVVVLDLLFVNGVDVSMFKFMMMVVFPNKLP